MSDTTTTMAVSLLPEKAAKKVNPKPSKTEIINALVELKRQEYIKESVKLDEKYNKTHGELEQAIKDEFKSSPDRFKADVDWCEWNGGEMVAKYSAPLTPKVRTLIDRLKKDNEARGEFYWNDRVEKQVKASITQHVCGSKTNRVKLMLDTPEIRKALQKSLDDMNCVEA